MLQRALRHWSGVHYHHWSYGHFRWPFQQALLKKKKKKNIRFAPTNSWNPILMAHSCGLGGKYWYKHMKVFHTEHLKRLVQGGLEIFFSFCLTASNLLLTVRQMLFLYKMTLYDRLFPAWSSPYSVVTLSESVSISPTGFLVDLAVSAYNRTHMQFPRSQRCPLKSMVSYASLHE